MAEQHRPEVLFSSLLALEVKTKTASLNAEDKENFAQTLNQIKDAIAGGYEPDKTQKSILNQLTSNDSPEELLEMTAQTLRDMPKTAERNTFIAALKTYQQEAINQTEPLSQPEENTTMSENTYEDFANKRKEITNLERHQRKNSDVDHSAEIIDNIKELITMYEGMTSLEDKRKAKDSLRSVVRLVDTEKYAELSGKLDAIINDESAPQPEATEEQMVVSDKDGAEATPNTIEAEAATTMEEINLDETNELLPFGDPEEIKENTVDGSEAEAATIYNAEMEEINLDETNELLPFGDPEEIKENTVDGSEAEAAVGTAENEPITSTSPAYSEEEVQALLNSQDIDAYIASLNPKISEKAVDTCLSLNAHKYNNLDDIATALANPDDLLVAYDIYDIKAKKGDNITTLKLAIVQQLKGLDMNNISPETAFIWQHLAERIKETHPDTYDSFVSRLQDSLHKYDDNHFKKYGVFDLSADELNKNYQDATDALKDFEPTTEKTNNDGETETYRTLDDYTFTDDNGKPLKDSLFGGKKLTETRNAILAQARELAAQELAKETLPEDKEQRQARLNEVMNEKIASILGTPDESKKFTQSDVAARLAGAQQVSEDFKTRVTQKFKDTAFAKSVTANVNQMDEKLTKKFGKPYTLAKKFLKLTAKVSWGAAKNAGLFAVAGMASPVGIPALIAYNTVKNWKNIKKQVNDPNISKHKKYGLYLGATLTTALSAMGAATGVGAMADAVGLEGVSAFCQNAGAAMGVASRTVAAAVGATVPNWIEKASLAIQEKKLEQKIKGCYEPEKLKELLDKQKQLKAKQQFNRKELIEKTLSVAIGSAAGMGIREGISSYMEANAATTDPTAAQETLATDTQAQPETLATDTQAQPETQTTEAEMPHDPEPVRHPEIPQEEQAVELTAEQQQAANNLEAAKTAGSGSNGQSSFDNAKTVLTYLQGHNPADRGINPEEVATSLSEHMGNNAGKTAMSCAMAPYALQNALHLDLPEGQAPTTHNMMSYIAEHGLTPEQQQAFNQFAEQNFDENGKFQTNTASVSHSQEQPDASHGYKPNTAHTEQQAQPEKSPETRQPEYRHKDVPETGDKVVDYMNKNYAAERTDGTGGYHFERVNHLPGEEEHPQQPEHTAPRQPRVEQPQPRHVPQHPVETYDVTTAAGWAGSRGLILDPMLTQSLNRLGDDGGNGYAGAYIDPNKGTVICVPNDPIHDKPYTIDNPRLAAEMMRQGIGPWSHSNAGHQNWYGGCADGGIRHLHGSGIITHNNTINKVIVGVNTASNVITNIAAGIHYMKHSR